MDSTSPAPAEGVVLVIDDEPAIGQVIETSLRLRNYVVHVASNGAAGLQLASAVEPDVMIVDLGLPDLDGVEVCRRLRRWTLNPILVLTVDDGENRKVEALDSGADDYVTKPFSMPELLARVRVASRHRWALARTREQQHISVGPLSIDVAARRVLLDGVEVDLRPKEYALLVMLASNADRVVLHRVLIGGTWGDGRDHAQHLRLHVHQLRQKLEGSAVRIHTDSGVGYRLTLA